MDEYIRDLMVDLANKEDAIMFEALSKKGFSKDYVQSHPAEFEIRYFLGLDSISHSYEVRHFNELLFTVYCKTEMKTENMRYFAEISWSLIEV